MSRQSVAKAHQKIQELSWEPKYHEPQKHFGTDYTFRKAPKKDPLKQVLRSYFPMEEEKDHRVYGAEDGAIRGNMFRQVQERWMEWQKLFLSIIPLPEISAARAMPLIMDVVPNPEIHNTAAIQMIDEVRHSTIQQNLKRIYMKNYIDPAGFNSSLRSFQNNYAGTIGRQFAEGFITGDAITAASMYLTIVAETAFTNTLFVAMPGEAAANGDYLLPTVFHSVQSDESRHISNGYATLLMALADEENRELLERDLRYAWWNNHAVVDAAIGTFIEYGTKDRRKDRESYAEMWRRWIYDDYYRSYLIPLEKYGLKVPHDLVEEAWNRIWNKGYVHEVAQFFSTGWIANYWRIDPMTDEDFEWFEYKYPGWYDKYGKWWENYARLSKPNGNMPIAFEAESVNYYYPHRCWTCMVPCLIREDMVYDKVDGQWRTYCSETCHWTDAVAFRPTYNGRPTPNMGKLSGKREWETLFHGWNFADIMKDCGYVRADGKTCTAQPHLSLDPKDMWTLDDIRKTPAYASPNVLLNEMTDAERELWAQDYKLGGPGGRYAETPVPGVKRTA
jgi:propane monooxygenase large subunit